MVDRLVELTLGGVDLELFEQRVHPERSSFVRDDGHDTASELLVASEAPQQSGEHAGRRDLGVAGSGVELGKGLVVRHLDGGADFEGAARDRTVQVRSSFDEVAILGRVVRGPEVRRTVEFESLVGDLVVERQPVPKSHELVGGEILDRVGCVLALDRRVRASIP